MDRLEYFIALIAFALLMLCNVIILTNIYYEKYSTNPECYEELQDLMDREKELHSEIDVWLRCN